MATGRRRLAGTRRCAAPDLCNHEHCRWCRPGALTRQGAAPRWELL